MTIQRRSMLNALTNGTRSVVDVAETCPSSMTSRFQRTWRRGDISLEPQLQSGMRDGAIRGHLHGWQLAFLSDFTLPASAVNPIRYKRGLEQGDAEPLTSVGH